MGNGNMISHFRATRRAAAPIVAITTPDPASTLGNISTELGIIPLLSGMWLTVFAQ